MSFTTAATMTACLQRRPAPFPACLQRRALSMDVSARLCGETGLTQPNRQTRRPQQTRLPLVHVAPVLLRLQRATQLLQQRVHQRCDVLELGLGASSLVLALLSSTCYILLLLLFLLLGLSLSLLRDSALLLLLPPRCCLPVLRRCLPPLRSLLRNQPQPTKPPEAPASRLGAVRRVAPELPAIQRRLKTGSSLTSSMYS